MKIRSMLAFVALCGLLSLGAQAAPKPAGIAKLDPAMAASQASDAKVVWHDVTRWGVEGREWTDEPRARYFDRLPAAAQKTVTPAVWSLSRDSSGMMARFKTDASTISVHYKVTKANLGMPHMPATGVSGIDLYARDAAGKWRWVNVTKPATQEVRAEIARGLTARPARIRRLPAALQRRRSAGNRRARGRPIRRSGAARQAHRLLRHVHHARRLRQPSRHGAYGDSRPPLRYAGGQPRLFRKRQNGQKAVGDYLVKIDAAVYVIDCLPNMKPADVEAKCAPLVRQLRAARPQTPIVLVEDRRNTNSWIMPERETFHTANHAALRAAFAGLQKEGIKKLYYIGGDHLYGDDAEGSTDSSHASDLGFMRQSDIFEPVIREALGASR